jgi:hypothetical protein
MEYRIIIEETGLFKKVWELSKNKENKIVQIYPLDGNLKALTRIYDLKDEEHNITICSSKEKDPESPRVYKEETVLSGNDLKKDISKIEKLIDLLGLK